MGREEGLLTQAPGTFLGEVRERQHAPEGQAGTKGGGQRQEVVSDAPGLVAPFLPPSSFQDVSSNELQSLPAELCSLPSLRDLNVRRNQLSTLPDGEEKEELVACVCLPWRSHRQGIFTEKSCLSCLRFCSI